jgi:CRISPR/Cas system-associated protein Csm6
MLYNLSREGLIKGALPAYRTHQEATNKFFLSALILSDPVVDTIRRELRRISPEVKTRNDDIRAALSADVLKREVGEGERAEDARRKIQRAVARLLRKRSRKT